MATAKAYNLLTIPEGVVQRTDQNCDDETLLKWSGKHAIPKIGERVRIRMNGLGHGEVVSYFTDASWLGVKVKLDDEPEWHARQNAGTEFAGVAHVFGIEIEPAKA